MPFGLSAIQILGYAPHTFILLSKINTALPQRPRNLGSLDAQGNATLSASPFGKEVVVVAYWRNRGSCRGLSQDLRHWVIWLQRANTQGPG